MTSTGTTRTTPTGSFHHAAIASTRIFDPTAALSTPTAPSTASTWKPGTSGARCATTTATSARSCRFRRATIRCRCAQPLPRRQADPASGRQWHRSGSPQRAAPGNPTATPSSARSPTPGPSTCVAPANEHGRSMNLVLTAEAMALHRTDVIDVAGTLVVPPLQWYLPGPGRRCSPRADVAGGGHDPGPPRARLPLLGGRRGCRQAGVCT